jgi:hypothetical protein
MKNAEKRHIFAPTYGDENRLGVYVLFEVYPNIVDIALAAQQHALAFDTDPVTAGYYSDTQVATPELGGEFVFTTLPDMMEDWLAYQDYSDSELPRLLPVELDSVLKTLKSRHRRRDDDRWDCRPARIVADKDDIRLQIADKHTPDCFVWTSDLWSFFSALKVDFDADGYAAGIRPGGGS